VAFILLFKYPPSLMDRIGNTESIRLAHSNQQQHLTKRIF
jgi:hypothetical protein